MKHYHRDNGVFSASKFCDDHDLKYQKLTFSGVGAKHKNGHAKWAIQAIMWMACTFMIHVSLPWNECDTNDIALWPFAIVIPWDAYTRAIQFLQSQLHTCSGLPPHVLDLKLQDGKKIPKWNHQSCLGQYLVAVEDHSLLVANMRHLMTGHFSSQFHIVFDDHLCWWQQYGPYGCHLGPLVGNRGDLYIEDKIGLNGSLI